MRHTLGKLAIYISPELVIIIGCLAGLTNDQAMHHNLGYRACPPGTCSEDAHPLHWRTDIVRLLDHHVASLEPDVIVFNTGFWDALPGSLDIHELAQAGLNAVRAKQGSVYFRTTTTPQEGGVNDTQFSQVIQQLGWRVIDMGKITRAIPILHDIMSKSTGGEGLYWDNVHFFPQGTSI